MLAEAISQLYKANPLPRLFLRTLIRAATVHPKLLSPIVKRLGEILDVVWQDEDSQRGFILFCTRFATACIPMMLSLTVAQLQKILTHDPVVGQKIVSHLQETRVDPPFQFRELLGWSDQSKLPDSSNNMEH